jgi:hypothetical protein
VRRLARYAAVKRQSAVPSVCQLVEFRDDCVPVYMLVRNHLVAQIDNTHHFSSTKH